MLRHCGLLLRVVVLRRFCRYLTVSSQSTRAPTALETPTAPSSGRCLSQHHHLYTLQYMTVTLSSSFPTQQCPYSLVVYHCTSSFLTKIQYLSTRDLVHLFSLVNELACQSYFLLLSLPALSLYRIPCFLYLLSRHFLLYLYILCFLLLFLCALLYYFMLFLILIFCCFLYQFFIVFIVPVFQLFIFY